MEKRNFTEADRTKLSELYLNLSFRGALIETKFASGRLNPFELLNETGIDSLRSLLASCKSKLRAMDSVDEWTASAESEKAKNIAEWRDFINLLIGYRLTEQEKLQNAARKAKLEKDLAALKDSVLTPSERMAAIQAEIDSL